MQQLRRPITQRVTTADVVQVRSLATVEMPGPRTQRVIKAVIAQVRYVFSWAQMLRRLEEWINKRMMRNISSFIYEFGMATVFWLGS